MKKCHATNSVQPTTTEQPTTTPYHVDKILLIKCNSSDSPCAVFHCNTLNGVNIVDSYIRDHCRKMPVTTDNHQGKQNIAVSIVKNDNTIQQFECIDNWGNWVIEQIKNSTVELEVTNKHIPIGCTNITSTTPSTHTEDNNTEQSTSYSIPLVIALNIWIQISYNDK
ncbi:hypothetical protein [Candidatus Tisiphia endosymbiont of Hybos culiciformis]|uniref:hypothetical protein n=1 Tax=Candidatus Tisiphia endosymbiont of Hybos culiciformis TaxID=3139331 RepID=UPI003CCAA1A9